MSQQTNVSFITWLEQKEINQTPDLNWGHPYGNDLRSSRKGSGTAGGTVEGHTSDGRTLRKARWDLVSTASGYKDWLAHF